MMHERLSFNGAPITGLGAVGDLETRDYAILLGIPFAGLVVGVVGGAMIGAPESKALGSVIGGIVGTVGGVVLVRVLAAASDRTAP